MWVANYRWGISITSLDVKAARLGSEPVAPNSRHTYWCPRRALALEGASFRGFIVPANTRLRGLSVEGDRRADPAISCVQPAAATPYFAVYAALIRWEVMGDRTR